jgi:hypothetical protein
VRMPRKGFYQFIVTILLVCLAMPLALGADFWAKKPYQNWSKEETNRMLEESPWAMTLTVGSIQRQITGLDATRGQGYGGEMDTNPTISYTLRFQSAEPIREAQVRSSQLNSRYESMSAEQKTAFDTNAGKFLAAKFPDRVVVSVTFSTDLQNYEGILRTYWGRQSLATIGASVFLNAGKERLGLVGYSCKDNTFQFVFPRPKQIGLDDKLGVEFNHPRTNAILEQRILREFSLKKMLFNGEPAF